MGTVTHMRLSDALTQSRRKIIMEKLGDMPVITATMNYASPRQLFMKRCLDITGGLIGCILTGILCIFLAPAIYIQSPGPIFFSQIRVGKNGKQFRLYKFRSMYMDAEERKAELMKQNKMSDGKMFKLDELIPASLAAGFCRMVPIKKESATSSETGALTNSHSSSMYSKGISPS